MVEQRFEAVPSVARGRGEKRLAELLGRPGRWSPGAVSITAASPIR